RDPVRREALVDALLVVDGVLAGGPPDRGLDPVLRHVDRARVVHRATERRVGVGVGAPLLDRDRDVLRDPGELLRHAVPPREHRDLALLEDAAHDGFLRPLRSRPTLPRASPPVARRPGGDYPAAVTDPENRLLPTRLRDIAV